MLIENSDGLYRHGCGDITSVILMPFMGYVKSLVHEFS
jgi:hypothetical protein